MCPAKTWVSRFCFLTYLPRYAFLDSKRVLYVIRNGSALRSIWSIQIEGKFCHANIIALRKSLRSRINWNSRHGSRVSLFLRRFWIWLSENLSRILKGHCGLSSERAGSLVTRRWTRSREIRRSSWLIDRLDQTIECINRSNLVGYLQIPDRDFSCIKFRSSFDHCLD